MKYNVELELASNLEGKNAVMVPIALNCLKPMVKAPNCLRFTDGQIGFIISYTGTKPENGMADVRFDKNKNFEEMRATVGPSAYEVNKKGTGYIKTIIKEPTEEITKPGIYIQTIFYDPNSQKVKRCMHYYDMETYAYAVEKKVEISYGSFQKLGIEADEIINLGDIPVSTKKPLIEEFTYIYGLAMQCNLDEIKQMQSSRKM